MPIENRSSTTEMVRVPRERLHAWQERFSKAQMFQQSTEVQAALARPTSEPHPEPTAWIVGTAIWWTKEEAERDAAATGLAIDAVGQVADSGEVERLLKELGHMREERDDLSHKLAERDALLRKCLMAVREQHCDSDEADFDLPANLMTEIDASLAGKS